MLNKVSQTDDTISPLHNVLDICFSFPMSNVYYIDEKQVISSEFDILMETYFT